MPPWCLKASYIFQSFSECPCPRSPLSASDFERHFNTRLHELSAWTVTSLIPATLPEIDEADLWSAAFNSHRSQWQLSRKRRAPWLYQPIHGITFLFVFSTRLSCPFLCLYYVYLFLQLIFYVCLGLFIFCQGSLYIGSTFIYRYVYWLQRWLQFGFVFCTDVFCSFSSGLMLVWLMSLLTFLLHHIDTC